MLPAVDLCGWMMTNRRGARATGDGLPERTKLAAVLAANARPHLPQSLIATADDEVIE